MAPLGPCVYNRAAMLVLGDTTVREIDLDGTVVYVLNLTGTAQMDVDLRFQGEDYRYASSVLAKGYGAVLPGRVHQALEEGRKVLLVQRGERYYLYRTSACPPSQP